MVEEQLGMPLGNDTDWVGDIEELCESAVAKHQLPTGSIYLQENKGRKGEKDRSNDVVSRSICFYEPNYPGDATEHTDATKNTVIMNIVLKENKTVENRIEFIVGEEDALNLDDIPQIENKGKLSGTSKCKYQFLLDSQHETYVSWLAYIAELIELRLANYSSKARSFGCCSRFNACSDAKHCLHPNKMYACACSYKRHLEAGEIFYGKNKNA